MKCEEGILAFTRGQPSSETKRQRCFKKRFSYDVSDARASGAAIFSFVERIDEVEWERGFVETEV